jgi:uncharacterized protein
VVVGILRAMFGRLPAALIAGGATGFIAFLIAASLAASVVVAILVFMFTLLAGSQGFARGPRSGGWGPGGGGGWGSGGWGGGGGGSWSGGGGGFGGGGASGRW